jgi:hypothetical protein
MCLCPHAMVGLFTGNLRLLFVLMTVIWMTNQGCQPVRRTGVARIRSSDWLSAVAEDSPMPPGNSAQLGRESNSKRKEFGPKGRIEDSGPKEPCENVRIGQCSRRVYPSVNDSVTCERIHKIGVLPPQCSAVRRPTQSRTPAVDPQSSTRPPWRGFFLRQILGQSRRPHRHQRER